MVELRILSGLHRGATLPLDARALVIGASEEADVVLVDRGIEERHATLAPDGDGWSLSPLDGPVLGAQHNTPLAQCALDDGDFARLGGVWLCLSDAAAPWQEPPPEPRQEPYLGPEPAALSAADNDQDDTHGPAAGAAAGADAADDDELYEDSPLDAEPAVAVPPPPPPKPQPAQPAAKLQSGSSGNGSNGGNGGNRGKAASARRFKLVLMPLMLVTFLSACAAYAITGRGGNDDAQASSGGIDGKSKRDAGLSADGLGTPAEAAAAVAAAMKAGTAAPSQPSQPLSPLALQEAFRQRLREVDLLKRIHLDLNQGAWEMQASLDAEEAARFDRILKAFVKTHNIRFPVHARVGGTEVMLPFKVREVVSGAQASIVTQDGRRLYVGDEYRGLRLVAVENGQLLFDGERKIRVKW